MDNLISRFVASLSPADKAKLLENFSQQLDKYGKLGDICNAVLRELGAEKPIIRNDDDAERNSKAG